MAENGRRLSVSTWSLHRQLGPSWWDSPEQPEKSYSEPWGPGALTLPEMPARLASFGIHTLEICHFHLSQLDDAYLERVRAAHEEAGVSIFSLLIDDGDISSPQHQARDLAWIEGWLAVAGKLGADCARVIGGKTLDDGAVARSRDALASLADVAARHNVNLMTENWFDVTGTPDRVCELLEPLRDQVSLCVDFGNWKGATKYDDFAQVMPYAGSTHAKCSFTSPLQPDAADFERCLQVCDEGGFSGPHTLIYDGPDDDEWAGLRIEADMVRPWLG
ncbi:MAG: TIM barrel protein [Anaerolineaceae bacterium]|nr:TIM barrel protein [Anaerolineaceae bacterium]